MATAGQKRHDPHNMLDRIKAALPSLAPAEQRVGKLCLSDPRAFAKLPVSELAAGAAARRVAAAAGKTVLAASQPSNWRRAIKEVIGMKKVLLEGAIPHGKTRKSTTVSAKAVWSGGCKPPCRPLCYATSGAACIASVCSMSILTWPFQ